MKIQEVYKIFGVESALEMSLAYTRADQELMKSGNWDYDNPQLLTNRTKIALEAVTEVLDPIEKEWVTEILWFWNHHAISCAISKDDKEAAKRYAKEALILQGQNHPNQITRMLAYLVNDQPDKAKSWMKEIKNEPEKTTARELMAFYEQHGFFSRQAGHPMDKLPAPQMRSSRV